MKPYYQDDLVTLYHGDALEVREWLDADVLVTDPPYGINVEQRFGSWYGGGERQRQKNVITNDENTEIRDKTLKLWGNRPAIVFGSWKAPRPADTTHRLIWWKRGMPPGPTNAAFMSQDEEIYIIGTGFVKSSPPMRSVIETKESRPIQVSSIGHPTPKPIWLMEQLISRCLDGMIADPFAGSGATLIAARNLGRQAIGVELEERYCEIIANRLSQQVFDFSNV